ncbi:phospholipid phosphatase 5 [Coccinella septempunctata]|uniref:phospholipid phosphatase 5 n=1 Tax=Coccinella septempunctata TaxID=41139 RepID=UPI001D08DFD5|nr:phospholipid phosphatase 5 [Coccinella septempunctata]
MITSRENLIEIAVRVVLMILFRYYDKATPFIRQIQPEELWLYNYPVTASYVPSPVLWCICIGFPTICFAMFFILDPSSRKECKSAISGLTLAFSLNAFLTAYIKILVGRPRPDFIERCFPSVKGTDFTKCTGRLDHVYDGRRSFPSGHSSFSFVVMVFMSLFSARRLEIWTTQRMRGLKLIFCTLPLLLATTIAISRTCDYHHHYQDIIVGSVMGSVIAYVTFQLYLKRGGSNSVMVKSKTSSTKEPGDCSSFNKL